MVGAVVAVVVAAVAGVAAAARCADDCGHNGGGDDDADDDELQGVAHDFLNCFLMAALSLPGVRSEAKRSNDSSMSQPSRKRLQP